MKKLFSYLLLISALVFSGGKALAQSVNINDVVYSINGGSAQVTDYNYNGANDSIVVLDYVEINAVKYQVTAIANRAFYEGTDLKSVTLPAGISTIGTSAFGGCSNLAYVNFPDALTSIGDYAFQYCSKLTAIELPEGLNSIGSAAFSGCSGLTALVIPQGVTSIGYQAFRGCSGLTALVIPQGVTSIGSSVFSYCSKIASVTLPQGITSISEDMFYDCNSLTSIVIPEGVTSIGSRAFYSCDSLKTVTLPKSLTTLGQDAFNSCKALTTVVFPEEMLLKSIGTNVFYNTQVSFPDEGGIRYVGSCAYQVSNSSLTEYVIREGTTAINAELFYGCTQMTSVTIPNSVVYIGNNAFYNCTSLPIENGIRYADTYAIELTDKTLTDYKLKDNVRFLGNQFFNGCNAMTSITIPDGVMEIGYRTFYGCSSLASVTLGKGVTSIGQQAFRGCSALTSIDIPAGVATIGNEAFYGCSSLASATLGEGLKYIGQYAFNNCSALTSIDIPAGVTTIGEYAFQYCSSLASATLGEGLESIGQQAFYYCSALTSIDIPTGVATIGNEAFYGCSSLASATLGEGLTTIGSYAFSGCSSLKNMVLPEGVTSIGGSAFSNCNNMTSINIPQGVTKIPEDAFYSCSSLKKMVLPEGLTTIGNEAFRGCSALTSINIPAGVTTIGESAFYGCSSLTAIVLPEGLTSIANGAFNNCGNLHSFEWPSTLTSVGNYNLGSESLTIVSRAATPPAITNGCSNRLFYVPKGSGAAYKELYPNNVIIDGEGTSVVVEINEAGTLGEEILKQVSNLSDVNNLTVSGTLNATDLECIKNSSPNLIALDFSGVNMKSIPDYFLDGKSYITQMVLPVNTEVVGSYAFQNCRRMKEITLPDSLEAINYRAFAGSGLSSIVIPEGITTLGTEVFYNCKALESVNIPTGITSLPNYTFSGCSSLKSVEIPDNITSIGNYAFSGCYALDSVTFSDNITSIGEYAFSECGSLRSITLPQELKVIYPYAFRSCSSLTSLEIPGKVTAINYEAFRYCRGLKTVTMNGVVRNIGGYAFADCSSLQTVTLPSTLIKCEQYIFNGCSNLKNVTCPALFPPTVTNGINPNNSCVLYVPEWTLEKFKLATGWSAFNDIQPITGIYPTDIAVYKEESLSIPDAGLPEDYKPNMTVAYNGDSYVGRLTVRGEMPLALTSFEMQQTRSTSSMTSLINNGNVTADSVVTRISMSANTWHYLTFPYDVKVSDIITEGGDWIICYYDGEARAQADFGNTWKTVPFDSILHAGQGYIWHSTKGNFTVPAVANDNRNLIFANDTRYIQLKEHAASTVANYGWNLIGNPYPCYFDTRFMEFSSPITVRSGSSYAAYSPLDDSYILKPHEAFFVQCSADNNVAGFTLDGRQTNDAVREIESAPSYTRGTTTNRSVLNFYLENNSYADHTRLVVNEAASLEYEIACDASKFMSDDNTVPQLFTIENEERMAINERPMADGKAILGVYIGVSGNHTISLDTRATDTDVVLIDKVTGAETDLIQNSYTFTAEAGTYTDRFEIRMTRTGGIVDAIGSVPTVDVKVVAISGAITIANATEPIYVYNAAGALIAKANDNAATLAVEPGIYVVKVGDKTYKVSVVK